MKKGDWVYCEFELQIIKDMTGKRITEVSTGNFSHSGSDLSDRCFPLEITTKLISGEYEYASNKLHKDGCNGLNFPDIHRWLVEHWAETCRNKDEKKEYFQERYAQLHEFTNEILKKCADFRNESVGGVRLGRR